MISIITPLFTPLFQFVNDTNQNRYIVLLILLLGTGLTLLVRRRLVLIASNQDKYYSRLVAYQVLFKNSKEMK